MTTKQEYRKNPEKYRGYNLRKKYKMSLQDYDDILLKQNGKCAICGYSGGTQKLAVDHDHKTGRIRGLICKVCNRNMGIVDGILESLSRTHNIDFEKVEYDGTIASKMILYSKSK